MHRAHKEAQLAMRARSEEATRRLRFALLLGRIRAVGKIMRPVRSDAPVHKKLSKTTEDGPIAKHSAGKKFRNFSLCMIVPQSEILQ